MAVLEALASRVEQRARAMANAAIERAATAFAAVPGFTTTRQGDDLRVQGRGLTRRLLTDVRIRFGLRGLR